VEEAKGAAEMMYVGSTLPILPIVMWDEQPIGDGNTTILFTFFFFFWLMEAFYLDALYSQHIILYYIIFSPRVSCLLKVCLERLNFPYHWCIAYILIYAAIIV